MSEQRPSKAEHEHTGSILVESFALIGQRYRDDRETKIRATAETPKSRRGAKGMREAEAVFQAIGHKRAKTRLAVNGRDGNHDATCMLVLISPDIARERLSFRRIVLFTSSLPAAGQWQPHLQSRADGWWKRRGPNG